MKLKFLVIAVLASLNVLASKVYEFVPKYVEEYKFPEQGIIKIPTSFAQTNFELSSLKNQLSKVNIVGVELLYSNFSRSSSFNQTALNKFRYNKLVENLPQLKDVNWSLVAQKAIDYQSAKSLFHGFVIHYQEIPTKKTCEKEISEIKKMISGGTHKSIVIKKKDFSKEKNYSSEEMEDVLLEERSIGLGFSLGNAGKKDSTLFKIFNRNKHWKNKQIVCDVTGSMAPYTGQLMLWLKLNENRKDVKGVTFFNDGDNMPDREKAVGKVGGIYSETNIDFDNVSSTLFTAMINGFGGDGPENNIEASLRVLNENKDCKEIIMIADNWATPRDMSLLSRVKVPIRIILCGAYYGVNSKYLDIARRTGGSVHTMEDDLNDLFNKKEGEEIEISGQKFVIKSGKFIKLTKL